MCVCVCVCNRGGGGGGAGGAVMPVWHDRLHVMHTYIHTYIHTYSSHHSDGVELACMHAYIYTYTHTALITLMVWNGAFATKQLVGHIAVPVVRVAQSGKEVGFTCMYVCVCVHIYMILWCA